LTVIESGSGRWRDMAWQSPLIQSCHSEVEVRDPQPPLGGFGGVTATTTSLAGAGQTVRPAVDPKETRSRRVRQCPIRDLRIAQAVGVLKLKVPPGGAQFPGTSPAGNRPVRHIFPSAKLAKTFFFAKGRMQASDPAFADIKQFMSGNRII
jgi:hypothetical protein